MRRLTIAVATSAVLIGACADPGMPRAASEDLQGRVDSIRLAAETGKVGIARARLDALISKVAALLDHGVIDEAKAQEILAAADVVRAALPTPVSAARTENPSPSPVGEEGKGKGKDKGHGDEGHGNDD